MKYRKRAAAKQLTAATLLSAILLLSFCPAVSGCRHRQTNSPALHQALPDSLTGVSFDEHLTISVGFWNIQSMVNSKDKDDILVFIEDTFNITIEPVAVSWVDYKERYQVMSATNSLPDLFSSLTISSNDPNDAAYLISLIETNSIRSLPEDLSRYPNISRVMEEFDYIRYKDGRHYALPRLSFQDAALSSSDAAMIVRKDWMEALNLTPPSSLEEFIDMICAFARDDPDGNGIDDTIGYNVNSLAALGKWVMLGIAPECNVYTWVQDEDGTYIPSWLLPEFRDVVSAYRTMYERGGLDPDFYVKKNTDAVDDFAHGRLGALEYKSSPSAITLLENQWELHQEIPFEDAVAVLHIFPAPDGNYYSNSSNPFWSETLFSSNVDDDKMDRILYLLDYLLSEEGTFLTCYGMEGVDYIYENGTYQCLLDLGTDTLSQVFETKYPSLALFGSLATWGGSWMDFEPNAMNLLRYGENAMDLAIEDITWNTENTIPVDRPYDFLIMPKEYTDQFSTEQVMDDFISVIIGKEDPIRMWEAVIDGYYKNGLAEYISRQNTAFQNGRSVFRQQE